MVSKNLLIMKTKNVLSILIILFCSSSLFAQDIIRTKRDTIRGKVEEIGIDEIKYHDFSNMTGPLIVIEKKDVIEITYENGTKTFFAPDPYAVGKEVSIRNKTHSVKFEFFSPLTNDLAFGYETMIKVGTNLELKAAIIGPGFGQNTDKASGVFVKAGVKFLTSPTYVSKGVKYAHGLRGPYFKPELIINTYTKDYTYTNYNYNYNPPYNYAYSTEKVRYTNVGINIIFGIQHVLGNIITLDYYSGLGYAWHKSSVKSSTYPYVVYDDNFDELYSYSHLYFGKNFPLMITGGVTIGVLF